MSLSLVDITHLAFISLRGKPIRSGLTALGIFMGVFAVSAPLQVRNISAAILAREMEKREAPHAIIYPRPNMLTGQVPQLKLTDLQYLRARLKGLRAISTSIELTSGDIYFQDQKIESEARGVSSGYLETRGRKIIKGRFFTNSDFDRYRPVVIIDEFVERELFKGKDPLTQRIYFQNRPYFVIGVVQQRQQFFQESPQGLILMPITISSVITGRQHVDNIFLRPTNNKNLQLLGQQTVEILKKRYPGQEFFPSSNIEDLKSMERILTIVSVVLVVLGSIALTVGGVGITNITIASVLERTKEIGVRRALGATRSDVMWQFLLEAALISLFGGTLAIVTVHGITVVVSTTFNFPYKFSPTTAVAAVGSALIVGVGAGFVPAYRASRLDPVKALRSD
ncbi:MAG: ABC transporter permease [Prochloraceae cyanobacterium]|nr:ABC transporter permease [Prochloraceae cyanobacterium]